MSLEEIRPVPEGTTALPNHVQKLFSARSKEFSTSTRLANPRRAPPKPRPRHPRRQLPLKGHGAAFLRRGRCRNQTIIIEGAALRVARGAVSFPGSANSERLQYEPDVGAAQLLRFRAFRS